MTTRLMLLLALMAAPLGAAPEYPEMGPDIYDTKADGKAQIATALKQATAAQKHVLLVFGANWCIWCHRLDKTFAADPGVAKALRENFAVVHIDVNTRNGSKRNAEIDARYGNPIAQGLPVIVVLNAGGKQLTTRSTEVLEDGEGHSPKKILAFLAQWAPKRPGPSKN